jgi:hypothetical protein
VERGRHALHEGITGLFRDQVQRQVPVEVLQFDEEQFAVLGAAGVHTLGAVVDRVPVDEAPGEGEVGVGGLVGFEDQRRSG